MYEEIKTGKEHSLNLKESKIMDKFVIITNFKALNSYEEGELEDICSWDKQELNTDFTQDDWQWNGNDNVYERDQLVDADDCELSEDEYEQWKAGKFKAYTIHSQAKVYDLVRSK